MITYETIRKLVMEEKGKKKLNRLPDGFFEKVRIYLSNKGKVSREKDDQWELEDAKRRLQDLMDIREGKILLFAHYFVRSGMSPGELVPEEEEFFDRVVEQIKDFRGRKKEVLEGERENLMSVAFVKDVPKFVGVNMRNYGPFKESDVANIPEENAKLLIEKGVAKKLTI